MCAGFMLEDGANTMHGKILEGPNPTFQFFRYRSTIKCGIVVRS